MFERDVMRWLVAPGWKISSLDSNEDVGSVRSREKAVFGCNSRTEPHASYISPSRIHHTDLDLYFNASNILLMNKVKTRNMPCPPTHGDLKEQNSNLL